MTKKAQDFEVWRDSHLNINFSITGSNNNAYDLASHTACWILSEEVDSASLIRKETSGSGITITDASAGQLQITCSPGDWDVLSGHYYHELKLQDSASNYSVVAVGTALINK